MSVRAGPEGAGIDLGEIAPRDHELPIPIFICNTTDTRALVFEEGDGVVLKLWPVKNVP